LISGATAAAGTARAAAWAPKLGVLGRYSENNVEFVRGEGFTSIELNVNPKGPLDAAVVTDEQVQRVKGVIERAGLGLYVIQSVQNHVAPEPDAPAELVAEGCAALA
jgi:sugar phosphate isomerase/epimerase